MGYVILTIFIIVMLSYVYDRTSPLLRLKISTKSRNPELIKVLLGLPEERLNDLFKLYEEQFGPGAARYAQRTYRKWKAGSVRPNRQTFSRFLIYLPRVMSFDLKCEVLRKLRAEYCSKDNHQLTVYTDDWKEALTPLVRDIILKADKAELPKPVEQKLRWLADDEMQAARSILAESQIQESRN